ncbi:YlxR family protein [Prauserella oleivorans]
MQRPQSNSVQHEYPAGPVRTCVGCRRRALIDELLRLVVVDGALVVDERRRLPGRGAWVHRDTGCFTKAERRRAFPRALRAQGPLETGGARHALEQLAEQSEDPGPSRVPVGTRKQVDPS